MADQNSTPVKTVAPVSDRVPADYQRTVDVERHTTEHVHGKQTTFDTETKTDDSAGGVFDNRVVTLIDGRLAARKAAEDKRANHRNFNRLMTLVGAVAIGLVITYMAQNGLIPKAYAPYTFVITVLLDSSFSFYALIKHY